MTKSILYLAILSVFPVEMPPEYFDTVWRESSKYESVDPVRVTAIIFTESRFHARAYNPRSRTVGLMQIAPYWHSYFGVSRRDLMRPKTNIHYGVRILKRLYFYHHEWCPDRHGSNYNEHHNYLTHFRCHRDALNTRQCRNSLRSIYQWEQALRRKVRQIQRERACRAN